MVKQQLFIGAALVAGVAIGYFVQPQRPAAETETIEEAPKVMSKTTLPDVGEASALAALRARVKDLEAQLAARTEERVSTDERQGASRAGRPGGMQGMFNGQSRREWVENLKKENPQAYAAMTNGIAFANRNRLERNQKKLDFLSSVDTSRMSPSVRATHGALQDLIARREALDDGSVDWENLSDDEMRAQIDKRREIEGEIGRLSAIERRNLIHEAGKELGLQGESANDFAAAIQEIYDATETPGWWNRRGGGRGQGGRGQGGRGQGGRNRGGR